MTTARGFSPAVCAVSKTKLIACGGVGLRQKPLKSCEMLDLSNKAAGWTLISNMTQARASTSGILLPDGNTFLMIGGSGDRNAATASCEKLDIKEGTWSSAGNLSLGPRTNHRSVLYNDNVIVLGGFDASYQFTNTCEQYNATSNMWSQFQPSFIYARLNFGVAVVLDKIYIAGGSTLDSSKSTIVEVFDGTSWADLGSTLTQARSACTAVSFQNKLVVLGGEPATIEVFDPVTSTWNTTFPPMRIEPSRTSLVAVSF